jgi:hypothetical protein
MINKYDGFKIVSVMGHPDSYNVVEDYKHIDYNIPGSSSVYSDSTCYSKNDAIALCRLLCAFNGNFHRATQVKKAIKDLLK